MPKSFIWPIVRAVSGATTLSQSRPGSDGKDRLLYIPKSASITGTSPSYCLISYSGHSLGESYPSAEMQSDVFCSSSRLGHFLKQWCWRGYWFLGHFCWSLARRYFNLISINDLHRLLATNINSSYERKWSRTKKKKSSKRQKISHRNYYRCIVDR